MEYVVDSACITLLVLSAVVSDESIDQIESMDDFDEQIRAIRMRTRLFNMF